MKEQTAAGCPVISYQQMSYFCAKFAINCETERIEMILL